MKRFIEFVNFFFTTPPFPAGPVLLARIGEANYSKGQAGLARAFRPLLLAPCLLTLIGQALSP